MTGQASARASPGTEPVSRTLVQGRVPEGAQEFRPLIGVGQHAETVQGAQAVGERSGGGRSGAGSHPQVRVVRQRQVG